MRSLIVRIRSLLVLFIGRHSRLNEIIRMVYMKTREGGLRALFRGDTWEPVLSRLRIQAIINYLNRIGEYQVWLKVRQPGKRQLSRQRKLAERLAFRPLISVITPVFNPAPDVLQDTLQSVIGQSYPYWEFCIANGSPGNPKVRDVLDSAMKNETRIKVVHLDQNLGISGNSNAALQIAQGDYIVLLDHDDLLAPNMMYEIVCQLNDVPDADVVYFDEDVTTADKCEWHSPWFKPSAASPDLMLSTNYLMHSLIKRTLVTDLGGFDSEMDGAQDWDLALKLLERQVKFLHIPGVFYHWRAVPGSVASDADAKPWAYPAQKRCLEAHLARIGAPEASVEFPKKGITRIRWPLTEDKISIIIPTKDKVDFLTACITSILEKTSYPDYEIIIVDNGSTDPKTLAYLDELRFHDESGARAVPIQVLPYPFPYNFHRINNLAAMQAKGSILVFLNNDTEVLDSDWLSELAGWVSRPEIGIAGAKLLHPNGTIQHAGIIMGMLGHGSHVFDWALENTYSAFGSCEWYRDYQAVTGACLAIQKDLFTELGGFDDTYRVGYGDIDLCLRCNRAGYRVIYTPFTRILHHEGGTRGFSLPAGDVLRASYYMLPQATSQDEFYNPNLSHMERFPTLARPGEELREWRLLSILKSFDLIAPGGFFIKGKELFPEIPLRTMAVRLHPRQNRPTSRDKHEAPRALLITPELSRTGAPILLLEMAKFLAKTGWQVTMLSPAEGSLRQSCDQASIKVEIVASLTSDARLLMPYLADADLVMANTILTYRMVHAASAFGVPSIWWIYESKFGFEFMQEHPAAAQAMQAAGAVIFASNNTRNLYTDFILADNVYTIYTGIDIPAPACAHPLELDRNFYNVVLIASIEHRKGQDIFLKAYASLPPEIQAKTRCYLIGRYINHIPVYNKYYQQILKDTRSLPNIQILGELPEADVHHILSQADLFVLPSRDEVLPVTIIEAMTMAKPILTTRVGGIPEIIQNDVNGILVDADDPGALSEQLLRLVTDRELGQRLGQEARKTYETRLTYTMFTQQVMKIVDDLCLKADTPHPADIPHPADTPHPDEFIEGDRL